MSTAESVGEIATKSALVPGNIVELHRCNENSFLRIQNGLVTDDEELIGCLLIGSRFFVVVDAGQDCVVFFCPSHACCLSAKENGSAAANRICYLDDRPQENGSFFAMPHENGSGVVNIACPSLGNKSLGKFTVVQIACFVSLLYPCRTVDTLYASLHRSAALSGFSIVIIVGWLASLLFSSCLNIRLTYRLCLKFMSC